MRKMKINKDYLIKMEKEKCKKSNIEIYEKYKNDNNFWLKAIGDNEIDLLTYQVCNYAYFRYLLHEIVKYCFNDNEKLQKEISNKNLTSLIFLEILEVENE